MTGREEQMHNTLKALEALLPPGFCGFVITEAPAPGTLGQAHGLAVRLEHPCCRCLCLSHWSCLCVINL
jgi:hypothetical protein